MDVGDLYDEHVDKVYKFFYIKCLDRAIAEDLTSETFISLMEQLSVQEIQDSKKYLYGIMRNTWLHFLRNKYREALVSVENIDDFASHVESNINDFDEATSAKNRLQPYIDLLSDRQREVLVLRLIDDLSVSEIAKQLNRDKNYVKTTYRRSLITLRTLVAAPYMEGRS